MPNLPNIYRAKISDHCGFLSRITCYFNLLAYLPSCFDIIFIHSDLIYLGSGQYMHLNLFGRMHMCAVHVITRDHNQLACLLKIH